MPRLILSKPGTSRTFSRAGKFVFYLFFYLNSVCIAKALAEARSPLSLNWKEATSLLAQKNPALQAARQNVRSAEVKHGAAKWQLVPQLSAEFSLDRSGSETGSQLSNYAATLGLRQNLFNFSDFAGIQETRAKLQAEQAAFHSAQAVLVGDLKRAFATLVFTQSSVELSESIIQRRRQNLELVTLRFEGGRENAGSVELSRANFLESELSKSQADNALVLAQAQLGTLLDLEEVRPIRVTDKPPLTPPPLQVDFESLARQAPELKKIVYEEELSRAAVRSAWGKLIPAVNLNANLGKQGERFFPEGDRWTVGVSLSIPFGNGVAYYNVAAAKAAAQSSFYRRVDATRTIRDRIRAAHNFYVESDKAVQVAQVFLKAARLRAQISRQKYETGLISFDEWDRIETDLVNRETAFLRTSRDRVFAEADWESLIGGLNL